MISALADDRRGAARRARRGIDPALAQQLLDAAVDCALFLLTELRDERGRLLRSYNDGRAKIGAYLEDHAFLLEALLVLFETTCEERWFDSGDDAGRRADRALRGCRARRLLLDRRRPRAADRAAQGSRGLADPRRRLQRRDRACCAWRSSPATSATSATPCPCCACCTRSRRAIRRRSGTCCRSCTGTSPPRGRSPARSRPRAVSAGWRGANERRRPAGGGPPAEHTARSRAGRRPARSRPSPSVRRRPLRHPRRALCALLRNAAVHHRPDRHRRALDRPQRARADAHDRLGQVSVHRVEPPVLAAGRIRAPLILLAQTRQADRDHVRDELLQAHRRPRPSASTLSRPVRQTLTRTSASPSSTHSCSRRTPTSPARCELTKQVHATICRATRHAASGA